MENWKQPLRFERLSQQGFYRLASGLRALGYCPEKITAILALSQVDDLYPLDYHCLPRWDEKTRAEAHGLSAAVRLFLLGLAVERDVIQRTLGTEQVGFLEATALTFESGGRIHPRMSIVPFEDLLIVTDRLFLNADPESSPEGVSSDNCVWRLDRSTLIMFRSMRRCRTEDVLDLGCGSGVLSLLAARDAARVIGIDINPRAVNVARFNARLNGIENIEFVQGDLYRPVSGRSFDYIFSNPPSVPGLVLSWNREAGATGRDMVEAMLRGLGKHLRPGGIFQTTAHFGYQDESEIERWVGGFLCSGRYQVEHILIGNEEEAETFALREAHQKAGSKDYDLFRRTYDTYIAGLAAAGIAKIRFGILRVKLV